MFPTLLGGLSLLAVSLRYALRAASRDFPAVVCLGAFTLTSGGLSFLLGVRNIVSAVAHVDPADKLVLMVTGTSEAGNNLFLALVLSLVGALIACVGGLRASFQTDSLRTVLPPR